MPISQVTPRSGRSAPLTAASSADALAATLESLGVTYLFGMDSPEPLYAALGDSSITPITVRDERSAAVMADAFARVSRRPGVCTGIHGPGATNLVQGVIEAWFASTPVVAVASELSRSGKYRNELQDLDHEPFFSSITKWFARVESPERVAALTARAFAIATGGRPGPVYLGYPSDVLSSEPDVVPTGEWDIATYPAHRVSPDPISVERAVALLASARCPSIIAGGGVLISGATQELAAFADVLKAPVATTPLGKGAFDETDARAAGVVGAYTGGSAGRGRIANSVVLQSDVVVVVGSKTDSVATAEWTVPDARSTIIHIDVDSAEIGRNYAASLPLVGDAKLALSALTRELASYPARSDWAIDELATSLAAWRDERSILDGRQGDGVPPERVLRELSQVLRDDMIVTTDASYSSAWALDLLEFRAPGRRFLAPRGYGSLGWGLPAALGAKLADPGKKVVCVTGDGGFGYVFQELETAARYGIAVVVVVLNNCALGFQRDYEQRFWGVQGETQLLEVDYAQLARVLRCDGIRVEAAHDVKDALSTAIAADCPMVVDVLVDPTARPAITWFD